MTASDRAGPPGGRPPHGPAPAEGPAGADEGGAASYARAGVDLGRDEAFVERVKEIGRGASRPEVLSAIGGFAGLFKAPERYREPVFVAGADGVGTKLKLAAQAGRYETVGIDCVAMVVNDLLVQGAEPLVFLDYLAMGSLEPEVAEEALRGVAEGCRRAGCALLGGETASMPGLYAEHDLELVGFGVGVVERDRVIDGSSIHQGDVLVGLGSNGLHSNGFSLVRQIVDTAVAAGRFELRDAPPELNAPILATLLAPTRIYVKPVQNVLRDFTVHGLVHVTGGGFEGNLPRVLPKGVRARLDLDAWTRPPVFDFLQRHGEIPEAEMRRVFNCGIGFVLVLPRAEADDVVERLNAMGERAHRIGVVERKEAEEPAVLFEHAAGADR